MVKRGWAWRDIGRCLIRSADRLSRSIFRRGSHAFIRLQGPHLFGVKACSSARQYSTRMLPGFSLTAVRDPRRTWALVRRKKMNNAVPGRLAS
jgi:hypothetical protein